MRTANSAAMAPDPGDDDVRIDELFRREYRPMVRLAYTLTSDNARAE